jgi:hypothetical protein
MLVILTKEQIIPCQKVCQNCLLANSSGLPRWREGKLGCGQILTKSHPNRSTTYECQMGFQLVNVD